MLDKMLALNEDMFATWDAYRARMLILFAGGTAAGVTGAGLAVFVPDWLVAGTFLGIAGFTLSYIGFDRAEFAIKQMNQCTAELKRINEIMEADNGPYEGP